MSKDASSKYHQDKKEDYERKLLNLRYQKKRRKRRKSNNMFVNDTKIYHKMKSKVS